MAVKHILFALAMVLTLAVISTGQVGTQVGTGIVRSRTTANFILFTPTLFANLGTPANGTMVYCSNCDTAAVSGVCASTPGTGAFAVRINGAWSCN